MVEKKEKGGKKDRKDKKGGAGMEVGVVEVKGSKKIGAAARLLMRCLLNRFFFFFFFFFPFFSFFPSFLSNTFYYLDWGLSLLFVVLPLSLP